ncbi:MAG: hypothetical protein M0Z46_14605 [Actinomycetota bacterium]|nr:hypothetical protein [Actinomycetota bacterium]
MPQSASARRRRRSFAAVVAVVVVGLVAWFVASSGSTTRVPGSAAPGVKPRSPGGAGSAGGAGSEPRAAGGSSVTASLARWHLPEPLSRAGAATISGGQVVLLGGMLASGASSSDVGLLSVSTGKLTSIATLPSPTHDAASAVLGAKAFLFGGGQSAPVATVQAVTLPVASAASGSGAGVVTGQLPQARSDDEAVTLGGTAYVVGGYDGAAGDPAVLATQDGVNFSTVVTLPVGVRYPAVAAAGGRIYVFGGEATSGGTTTEYTTPTGTTTPPPGQQVAVVQVIDPQTGSASVVGYLPHAVQGAAAFELGGHIYLAGGDSNEPGTTPSSGSTIWSFDPANDSFRVAGHLAAPVAYAAVAVVGRAVWLVGGERDGVPVASAQRIVLSARG